MSEPQHGRETHFWQGRDEASWWWGEELTDTRENAQLEWSQCNQSWLIGFPVYILADRECLMCTGRARGAGWMTGWKEASYSKWERQSRLIQQDRLRILNVWVKGGGREVDDLTKKEETITLTGRYSLILIPGSLMKDSRSRMLTRKELEDLLIKRGCYLREWKVDNVMCVCGKSGERERCMREKRRGGRKREEGEGKTGELSSWERQHEDKLHYSQRRTARECSLFVCVH